ncbi:hypothetical protein F444_09187 [Phytophthora nicotianae P1976]|uniref:Uncharacterized protein n=1 Tax=Phytophthora nicotianae P1976 TaxID=1317066 RepID=A0A081A8H1_PHYNI|nr:hypothetical protein F444_09187 [Phytophthora nicotianae P1976]
MSPRELSKETRSPSMRQGRRYLLRVRREATVTPASAAFDPRETARHPSARVVERHSVAGMPFPESGTPRRQEMTPVRAVETPTRRAGTPTSDSALQEMLVDTFRRARQRLLISAGTPTSTPQPARARPVTRPVPASTGSIFVGQARPASTTMLEYQGSMAPRAALPAPASTPVAMPMAAIPSYGEVTIQVPRTSRNDGGNGAARRSALYPPFQPPITPTAGWNSDRMLPAWSPASMGGHGCCGNFSGQGGSYQTRSAYPQGIVMNRTLDHGGDYAVQGIETLLGWNEPIVGIPTELRNAVKVIVPFYSDTATSERAAAFWRSFEKCTHGMDGLMRLTAFEQCLNGKIGQEWWYNSSS